MGICNCNNQDDSKNLELDLCQKYKERFFNLYQTLKLKSSKLSINNLLRYRKGNFSNGDGESISNGGLDHQTNEYIIFSEMQKIIFDLIFILDMHIKVYEFKNQNDFISKNEYEQQYDFDESKYFLYIF